MNMEVKMVEDFHKRKVSPDGYAHYCKVCVLEKKNKELIGIAYRYCLSVLPIGIAYWYCLLVLPIGIAYWYCLSVLNDTRPVKLSMYVVSSRVSIHLFWVAGVYG